MRPLLLALVLLAGCTGGETTTPAPHPAGAGTADLRDVAVPAGAESGRPRLALTPDGRPFLSWSEPVGDGSGAHALRYAVWADGGWSAARTAASGTDWFVNWADTPGVVPGPDGRLTAFWLVRTPGAESPYAYDIAVRQSADGGATWSASVLLNADGVAGEHGFVAARPDPSGTLFAWLDGRAYETDGAMTLRTAHLAPDGTRSGETVLDPRTCDCCPTALAVTAGGPLAAYRDRSAEEIRDIAVVRRVDDGWSAPRTVHDDGWRIDGCPVNGPALATDGDRVAVAWFTGAGEAAHVNLAVSADGGATFAPPLRLGADQPMGRVDLVLTATQALVTGLEATDDGAVLTLRRIPLDGSEPPPPVALAALAAGREMGFPRALAFGDSLLVAWTDPTRDRPLRTVVLPL